MNSLGRITAVDINHDDQRVYVDVALGPNRQPGGIKYRQPGKDVWIVPEPGDIVEVSTLDDGQKVAFSPDTDPSSTIPSGLSEGDVAIRLDDSTLLHMKKSDGGITLTCSGDLNLDAANIYVGDSANSEPVATASHTHDVTLSDGSTGTTGTPSDTTSNEME